MAFRVMPRDDDGDLYCPDHGWLRPGRYHCDECERAGIDPCYEPGMREAIFTGLAILGLVAAALVLLVFLFITIAEALL